jgi:hypothetical protein
LAVASKRDGLDRAAIGAIEAQRPDLVLPFFVPFLHDITAQLAASRQA